MATGRPDGVIALVPSPWRSSAPPACPPSTCTTTGNTLLYDDEFVVNMRRKHYFYAQYENEILVPSSRPPSPSSTHRVEHMAEVLRTALRQSPQSVPGMVGISCVRYRHGLPRVKLEGGDHVSIFRLANDERQWERWTAGEEVPSGLTKTEASAILRQRAGTTAVKLSRTLPDSQATRTKKRKLASSDEASTTSQLKFPTVKRLIPAGNKASEANDSIIPSRIEARNSVAAPAPDQQSWHAIAGNGTAAITPISSPPQDPGKVVQAVPASQERSLHVDPYPAPAETTLHTSFDLDSSISFEPPMTSTPTKSANLGPRRNARSESSDQPFTPRSKAANYVANMATPISEGNGPLFDSRALRRVPTLEQLIRAESAAKKRDRKQSNKQQKSESLGASQDLRAQSGPLEDIRTPTKTSKPRAGTSQAAVDAPDLTSHGQITPIHTPSGSQGELTPTASAVKRRTFGSVISFGSLGFSSQYDVESKIDDISRFMKDDVDDVFL